MDANGHKGVSIFVRILIVFMAVNIATSAVLIVVAYMFSTSSIDRTTPYWLYAALLLVFVG